MTKSPEPTYYAAFGFIRPKGRKIVHIYYDGYRNQDRSIVSITKCGLSFRNAVDDNTHQRTKTTDGQPVCKRCTR